MRQLYLIKALRWTTLVLFAVVMGLAVGEISTAMLVSAGWV